MPSSKKNNKKDFLEIKLMKGSRLAVAELIEERKKTNDFIIISENGKVKKVRARKIK